MNFYIRPAVEITPRPAVIITPRPAVQSIPRPAVKITPGPSPKWSKMNKKLSKKLRVIMPHKARDGVK